MAKKGEVKVILGMSTAKFERGIKRSLARIKRFSARVKRVGLIGAAAFAGIGFAVVKAAQSFAQFEKGLAKISTLLDNKTLPLMEEFGNDVRKLSLQFGQSTDAISAGLFTIISAQIKAKGATEVLTVATKLATAGFTTVDIATEALIRTMAGYNKEASEAMDVSDLLFKTMEKGLVTFEELAPNFGKVAGLAGKVGLSMEELGAAFAVISRQFQPEKTATAMRAILNAFLGATEAEKKFASEMFNVELSAAGLKKLGLEEVLLRLSKATADQTKKMFGNIRASGAMIVLLADIARFQDALAATTDRSGATMTALEKVLGKTFIALDRIKAAFKFLVDTIGEFAVSTKIFERIRVAITDIATGVKRLIDSGKLDAFRDRIQEIADGAERIGKAILGLITVGFGGGGEEGKKAANAFFTAFGNLIIAVFKTAAAKAVEVLIFAAKGIGALIGKGAKAAILGGRDPVEVEARRRAAQRTAKEFPSRGGEAVGFIDFDRPKKIAKRFNEILAEEIEIGRKKEFAAAGIKFDFGIDLKKALEEFVKSIDPLGKIFEKEISGLKDKLGRKAGVGIPRVRGFGDEGGGLLSNITGAGGPGFPTDALRRIGGTIGGIGGVTDDIQSRQLSRLDQIAAQGKALLDTIKAGTNLRGNILPDPLFVT